MANSFGKPAWQTLVWLGLGFGLSACMSMQRPLNDAEVEVEEELSAYVGSKSGCVLTWYEQWLRLLFPRKCNVDIKLSSGMRREGMPHDPDPDGNYFGVAVSDSDGSFCGRDSIELKKEARLFARRILPVLQSHDNYRGIEVHYSTCTPFGDNGCSGDCYKTIRLAVPDTTGWATAVFTQVYMRPKATFIN